MKEEENKRHRLSFLSFFFFEFSQQEMIIFFFLALTTQNVDVVIVRFLANNIFIFFLPLSKSKNSHLSRKWRHIIAANNFSLLGVCVWR